MTPSPLVATGLPVAAASPDTARHPFGDRPGAPGGEDFSGLLALLAGVLPAPAPAVTVAPGGPGAGSGSEADGPAPGDPSPSPAPSLEALVSALAQQASGLPVPTAAPAAGAATPPAAPPPEFPGAAAADRSAALADIVDRWAAAAPGPATGPAGPGSTGAPADPGARPLPPPGAADSHRSPVADLAHSGPTGGAPSPVSALAQAQRDGDASPVAALVHPARSDAGGPATPAGPTPVGPTPVGPNPVHPAPVHPVDDDAAGPVAVGPAAVDDLAAGSSPAAAVTPATAFAGDGAGPPIAAPVRGDGRRVSAGRDRGAAGDLTAIGSDPGASVRSVGNSGTAEAAGSTGPSVGALRRSPNGAAGTEITALHAADHPSARPAEAIVAPAAVEGAATPAAVADQIVSVVVPLHGRGGGRHDVTLELRPAELGTIRVEMSVEHQTVHLTLHAADPATGKLLAAALPDLRSALADAGLTAGHLGVGGQGEGAGQRRGAAPGDADDGGAGPGRAPRRSAGRTGPVDGPAGPDSPRRLRPAAAGRLDLFL